MPDEDVIILEFGPDSPDDQIADQVLHVLDRQVGVGGGLACEQLGAEEARLDDGRVDAERLDLEAQRLHPSL